MNLKGKWLSLMQLLLSLLAASMLLMLAAGIALVGGINWLTQLPAGLSAEDATLFTGMASIGFSALLLLPSSFLALQRLRGQPVQALPGRLKPIISLGLLLLLVLVLPASLGIGWLASSSAIGTALVLPLMHLLAISIPVLWLAVIALHGLPLGSLQRAWGVFGAGLVLGPVVIISLELVVAVAFIIAAGVIVGMDPARVAQLEELTFALQNTASPEQMITLITPVLTHPAVAALIFFFMAVVVPLIEETFKPIGLYLLLGRRITPVEGFAAGLLSGAGFGLFESLMLTNTGGAWVTVVVTRAGTGAVHMLTAGLTGYGLASALSEHRYLRLAGCFAAAVSIHGLWNGLAVLVSGAGLLQSSGELPQSMQWIPVASPLILMILAMFCFVMLIRLNHLFKQQLVPESNT